MKNPIVFSNSVENCTSSTDIKDVNNFGFKIRVRNFNDHAAKVTSGVLVHWFAINELNNDHTKIRAWKEKISTGKDLDIKFKMAGDHHTNLKWRRFA